MRLSYENNPNEIIDKLLEHHDIKTLRAIINSKARRKDPRGNNYFKIAVDVYVLQRENDSKLEWAIDQIAEQANISDKTVKNHITKFRNEVKEKIDELFKDDNYILSEDDTASKFIKDYIENICGTVNYENYTSSDYKKIFDQVFDDFKRSARDHGAFQ